MKRLQILKLYYIFLLLFELLHIYFGDAPSLLYRGIYTASFLFFCFSNISLIPIFIVGNLIIERFSIIPGEYLPNSMWFHVILLLFYLANTKGNVYNKLKQKVSSRDLKAWIFLIVYISIHSLVFLINNATLTTFSYLIFSFVFLLCLSKFDNREKQYLFCSIVYSTLFVCLFGLYNYDNVIVQYSVSSSDIGHVNRMAWKDSNYLSFWIGLVVILTIYLKRILIDKKDVFLNNVALLIFVLLLIMLISRGTIISLLLTMIYLYRKKIFSYRILAIALLILIIVFVFYKSGLLDGLIFRFTSEDALTGSGRNEIWNTAITSFSNQDLFFKIFGIGDGLAPQMVSLNFINYSTHNNYLEYLLNFGITGLLIFLYFLMSLFINSRTTERKAFIIFITINCMSIVPFMYVAPLWFFIPVIMIWDSSLKQ